MFTHINESEDTFFALQQEQLLEFGAVYTATIMEIRYTMLCVIGGCCLICDAATVGGF